MLITVYKNIKKIKRGGYDVLDINIIQGKMSEKCHICDVNEHEKNKKALITRLNRIEGQVKGVKKMMEEDIYCDDVLNQISSIKAALNGLSKALLERHINTCVVDKIKNDDTEVLDELLSTINKMLKL